MSILIEVFIQLGFEVTERCMLKPSAETLKKLEITNMHQWAKLIRGEKELSLKQASALSEWLNVPIVKINEMNEKNKK
jgi:hypothetical protein